MLAITMMVVVSCWYSSSVMALLPIQIKTSYVCQPLLTSSLMFSPFLSNDLPVSGDSTTVGSLSLWSNMILPSSMILADTSEIIDTVRTIAVGITAVLFFLAGLTLLMANIIIPAAANELEKECKELAPELWDEYLAKLESGQTMAQRPDLMQELGSKLQPLLDAKIAQQQLANDDEAWNTSPSLDLSALTDQMMVPPSKDEGMDKKGE